MPEAVEIAAPDDLLVAHATAINAAREKARVNFVEYITTVGSELKAAQAKMADGHKGFYKWALAEFAWSKSRVYQLITASDIVARLSTSVDDRISLPSNEAQCRALASLPEKHRRKAWSKAFEAASASGREPTATLIRRHAPRGSIAHAKADSAGDPNRLLQRLDASVRKMVLQHPDRLGDTVATLSSLIEFCQRPYVIAAIADATPKVSCDISPTLRESRIPLIVDGVIAVEAIDADAPEMRRAAS